MPWDGKSWISSFDHIENCSSSNPLSDYVYPQALLAPSPVSWFLPLLGLVESWSRNSRFFFPSFHIFGAYVKDLAVLASWIYMDGLISGWFVGTPILGHLHIHIYIYVYIEWLKSCPMAIQITIYRQWYYVLICIGHTAKSNHMCYHRYIALKGRHLLSFSGLNRCLRSIPRM